MEKIKKIAVVAVFVLTLFGIAAAHLLLPDEPLSAAERRKLAQAPEITAKAVFSGDYFEDVEKYLLDQFPGRQRFRAMKAIFRYQVLGMKDNNKLYQVEGHLMKLEPHVETAQTAMAVGRINAMIDAHPEMAAAYYAVIPDKNYFLAAKNGYPAMDYEAMLQQTSKIRGTYIDLFPHLTVEDYYRTDSHWRQDRILPTAQALAQGMGVSIDGAEAYTVETRPGFYGVYAGQAALPVEPDTLEVMESNVTKDAVVTSVEHPDMKSIYTWEDFEGMDPYDVYLSGAEALLTLENPHAANDRHLILFRDSFGSSMAPLLLSGYSKVTVVDLRYITSALVNQSVDFTDADVLFLYNTTMFNAGGTLK